MSDAKKVRSIIGRTNNERHAQLATEYLNSRYVDCGAIIEPSKRENDSHYLVMTTGKQDWLGDSTIVEACRAFLAGLLLRDFTTPTQ